MVLRNMRRFADPAHSHEYPLCSQLMQEFPERELLYLACIFHDIAKGRGGDHSELGMADARDYWYAAPGLAETRLNWSPGWSNII